MSEADIQRAILLKLRRIPNSFWFKATKTNMAGLPDITGDIGGLAFYIEVKADMHLMPSELQQYRINKAINRGAVSFCTFSVEDCLAKLKRWANIKQLNIEL